MVKKRKNEDGPGFTAMVESAGLHSVSNESRRLIFNASCRALDRSDAQIHSSSWKRLANTVCPDVFFPVQVKAVNGSKPVTFYMANLCLLLQTVIVQCVNYAGLIETALQNDPGLCFELLLYNDEATGGNILQPDPSKKASLWYFCLRELGRRWSEVMWHPFCLIQHTWIDKVEGGFSAVLKAVVKHLLDQNLPQGFPVQLPNGLSILRCKLTWMIADLDSLRAGLSSKGSAAIRCCSYCRNCIKRDTGLEVYDDYFLDVASSEIQKFDMQTDTDIFQVVDDLREKSRTLGKSAMQRKEKAAGLNWNEEGLLADQVLREAMPPSKMLLDPMHLYWSNGCAAWEINSIYKKWKETKQGNLESFLDLPWRTAMQQSVTASWRLSLAHESNFSGAAYKGTASNLQCFLPLFHFFLEGCLDEDRLLIPERDSLAALRRITIEMRNLGHETGIIATEKLQRLQIRHQEKVLNAYGHSFMRPKHHGRFHYADQMQTAQFYTDCFPCEKKHKLFKSHIGLHRFDPWATGNPNEKGEFSHFVLRDVWTHHLTALENTSFHSVLEGQTTQDAYMAELLGDQECKVSNSMHFEGRRLFKEQMVMGAHPGLVNVAIQSNTKFFVLLDALEMERESEFNSHWKLIGQRKLVPAADVGRSPTWWLKLDENSFLCLR